MANIFTQLIYMKYKILILLNFILTSLVSNNRLDIFLSFNDCISCFSVLSSLNSLNNFEKNIIILKEDSLVSNEFFDNIERPKDVNYIFSKIKTTYPSYCKITINNLVTDSFPLRLLSQKIEALNTYLLREKNTLNVPDRKLRVFNLPKNLTLKNDRLNFFVKKNYLSIYDYILNKIVLLKLDNYKDSITEVTEIKGNQFAPRLFLKTAKFDTVLYNKCYSDLKKMGKGFAHIESVFISDSSLFLLLNFPFTVKIPNDIAIEMRFFLYEKNLITHEKKLTYIDETDFSKKLTDQYLDNTRPFFVDQNKLFLSLYSDEKLANQISVLSGWKKANNKNYEFEKVEPLAFDKSYYLKNNVDSFEISLNRQFYYSNKAKIVIDYKKNSILKFDALELDEQTYVLDVTLEDNVYQFLTLDGHDKVELTKYDLKNQKIISKSNIKIAADALENSVKFYDKQHLIFMNKADTRISVMSITN